MRQVFGHVVLQRVVDDEIEIRFDVLAAVSIIEAFGTSLLHLLEAHRMLYDV